MITPSQREREREHNKPVKLDHAKREREQIAERERVCALYYLYGLNRNINREIALKASAYGSPAE